MILQKGYIIEAYVSPDNPLGDVIYPRWDQTHSVSQTDRAQSPTYHRLVRNQKLVLGFDPIRVRALCVGGDSALVH